METKDPSITILNNTVTKSSKGNGWSAGVMLSTALPPARASSWLFKVERVAGGVLLGICSYKLAVMNASKFNLDSVGHGFYLIGSGGGVRSHSDKLVNGIKDCFGFSKNDLIYVNYDPASRRLTFLKDK